MVEVDQVAQITFDQAAENFLAWSRAHHRAATTALHQNNLRALSRYFSGVPFAAVTRRAVEAFKLSRLQDRRRGFRWKSPSESRRTVSVVTVNRALTTLKLMYALAVRSGEFPGLVNPAAQVVRFRERGWMRVISRREEARYFAAIRCENLRDVARLMLETGIRPQEAMSLRAKDIDLKRRLVHIAAPDRAPAIMGKTFNAARSLPLNGAALAVLERRMMNHAGGCAHDAWRPGRFQPEAFLFPSESKTGRLECLAKTHHRAVRRARISPPFRLYDLRHTFATRAAELGVALPVLAALLGHSEISMTMRYVHPQADAMRAAIRRIEKGVRPRKKR
ncbi:MAG TPA: site-specific integrase [Terriglobia bacterium]|nr:site-specific integrase [Terriglobia bacterium]